MVKKYILHIITAVLGILFLLSFLIEHSGNTEKSFRTCLINPSAKDQLAEIKLETAGNGITFNNNSGIWTGSVSDGNSEIVFPVLQKKIESFISRMTEIRDVNPVSKNRNGDFGLKDHELRISFISQTGTETFISLGSTDFSGAKRYFSSENQNAVYKTMNDFEDFLYLNSRQWADQNLIPQNIYGKITPDSISRIILKKDGNIKVLAEKNSLDQEKIQYLLDLTHGNLVFNTPEQPLTAAITVELNNGKRITADFSLMENLDYLIEYEIPEFPGYKAEISSWTFNQLMAQFK